MTNSRFTCPNCLFEAPLHMFENVNNNKLKCRRCRSSVDDPNAYNPDVAYADCDSRRVINRFPFVLDGKKTQIYVRPGYLALVIGNDGSKSWLRESRNSIKNLTGAFHLYYVCLKPQINWGIKDIDDFGAYGIAHLSLSPEYVESVCNQAEHIHTIEDQLQALVIRHITEYAQNLSKRHSLIQLRHRDGYANALGVITQGVSLAKIEPKGYRNADRRPIMLSTYSNLSETDGLLDDKVLSRRKAPVEKARIPQKDFVIEKGIEEVFVRKEGKTDRHKAGESIGTRTLQDVSVRLRFIAKEFEFADGWGIYNQECSAAGFFSAHGTISFYIDSTERLAQLAVKPSSWQEFEEAFFNNVLKKVIASSLKEIIEERIAQKNLVPDKIREYLSAISVELAAFLNGETDPPRQPAFRQYGLRVKSIDVYHMNFYPVRR